MLFKVSTNLPHCLANWPTDQVRLPHTPASPLIVYPTQIMHEIPPEDEKPKKNGFSSNPRPAPKPDPKPKPAPKPDPKPKPKPKPAPKPRHTAERERRQVKLAQNVPTRSPSKPGKKDDGDGCGCIILIGVVISVWYFFFR
jgi:hypothetical protein